MTTPTLVDLMAARLTGIRLAEKYSADVLYIMHKRHPDVLSLKEGWLVAFVKEYLAPPKKICVPDGILEDAERIENSMAIGLALKSFAEG